MELSVIIPVYNKEAYLPKLLEDLHRQTFRDFECLLIDDGSTDGCAALCEEAGADPRFRVFHIPNGGVSHARNVGISMARGRYLTFLDSDDRVEPGYLARLMDLARRTGAELILTGFEKVRPDGSVICHVVPARRGLWRMEDLLPDLWAEQSAGGLYGFAFGKLISRRLLGDLRFDESLSLAEDLDFYCRLYRKTAALWLDGGTGYRYLEGAQNGTGSLPAHRIDYLAQLRILLRWRELFRDRGAYFGQNRALLEKRLADYAFFVLFHTPADRYLDRFRALYDLSRREQLELHGGDLRRRWLFFCLRRNLPFLAYHTMAVYRAIRRGLKRPCC